MTPDTGFLARLDGGVLRERFLAQGEVLVVDDFLPADWLAAFLGALPGLREEVNRNFLPGHKKGGSISRHTLDRLAPPFPALYRSPELRRFLEALTGVALHPCPRDDPHAYALYYYTEPGDHIGWHYDTSYYRGRRYTLLIGLVDRSSCRIEYRLRGATETASLALAPGRMMVFNGDRLQHRITPLGENQERIALTFEYLTDTRMHPFWRLISKWKDAVAYFGVRQVFGRRSA